MEAQKGKSQDGVMVDSTHSTVVGEDTEVTGKRSRTSTEKGKDYQLQILKGKFRFAVTKWQRQSNSITMLFSDSCDCRLLRDGRSKLNECFEQLCSVFDEICELDVDWPFSDKFDSISNEHKDFMVRISEILIEVESDRGSSRSGKRISSRASVCSASSKHSSRVSQTDQLCIAAEAAGLNAKLKFIEAEAKSKAELDRIETLKRLEIANAKLKVIESANPFMTEENVKTLPIHDKTGFVKDFIDSQAIKKESGQDLIPAPEVLLEPKTVIQHSELDPNIPVFTPKRPPENDQVKVLQQGLQSLTSAFVDQITLNRLPPPEPSIFIGDPIKYPAWKVAFRTLIEQKKLPEGETIHYLKKYLGGPALQVVENFFLLSNENAFEDAKKLLDERFGDPFVLAGAFRDKLESWPRISPKDSQGLLRFSDFLKQCLSASCSISNLSILNDSRENRRILSKLPEWLVSRWNRIASQSKQDKGEFPSFQVFVEFISREAKIANDPITSVQAVKGVSHVDEGKPTRGPFRQSPSSGNVGRRAFLSGTDEKTSSKPISLCYFCDKNHDLDVCQSFMDKSLVERKAFVGNRKLCFGCLKLGHISKDCRHRKRCRFCSKPHPSSLHGDVKSKDQKTNTISNAEKVNSNAAKLSPSGTTFLNGTKAISKCSLILPVYVSHSDCPSSERLVYALLDTQSDATFVLEDTCNALGISGVEVKLSLSTMHAENRVVEAQRVTGLMVRGFNSTSRIPLPAAYTRDIMPANSSHIPTPDVVKSWPYLHSMEDKLIPKQDCEIGLLIGYNCPRALTPREVVAPIGDGPYGQKTDLGWGVVGIVDPSCAENDSIGSSHKIITCEIPSDVCFGGSTAPDSIFFSLRTSVKEVITEDVLRTLEPDLHDCKSHSQSFSQEDRRFLSLLEDGITMKDGHYEMPLPFAKEEPCLPNNKSSALKRLNQLRKRLDKDDTFRQHYLGFMKELLASGHAEKVTEADETEGHVWYIPHHGVYHPHKPDKIRVVFDCSASFQGSCLNSHLLQGPDLINSLFGVICRFRKEPVAIMCDVEKMFYQFRVKVDHRNYLRFLWWENEDFGKDPIEYRMTVHLFGAKSSPGCANFGLKRMADDHEQEFGSRVANFIRREFYVDDGLKSVGAVGEAVELVEGATKMCQKAGLRLHKLVSNSKEVLGKLPAANLAKDLKGIDLSRDALPLERALGVSWCIESDTFQFHLSLKDNPLTRRGIMSTISSVYDPLGLISPVVLVGKRILQQICADHTDWDDPVPEALRTSWEKWRNGLFCLEQLMVPRCVKPHDFGEVIQTEMHHFSDGSMVGYGQCSYLRILNKEGRVHCALLFGKSRVAPLKPLTIPRLELMAALLSVRTSVVLNREFEYQEVKHFFWSDSQVVLGYVSNEARRFHVFVANRVQEIRNETSVDQWNYVSSKENPADIASRGVGANDLVVDPMWFKGPDFLSKPSLPLHDVKCIDVKPDDPEVRHVKCGAVSTKISRYSLLNRIEYFSDWNRAKRAIAVCLRLKEKLKNGSAKKPKVPLQGDIAPGKYEPVSVEELRKAEAEIFKLVQFERFGSEISQLRSSGIIGSPTDRKELRERKRVLKGNTPLQRLDPFIDANGLLRVGGRVQHSDISESLKFPILLPKSSHVTDLVVSHFHEKVQHQGRGITTNAIRANGIWIVGCSSVVSHHIAKCVACRRLRSSVQGQKMSDLPLDRLDQAPPFSYCAVDLFGPWYIKEGRKELKRYGVLFTCLSCRAVHVESANSLETDSFINCLRRFIAIRGPMRQLRCDRGTNFVGAEREIREALNEMDDSRVREFLMRENCDYFPFKMNVPTASHMGGVWERQIRSVRSVLDALLLHHGSQLNDESLRTFLHEAAAIVNCRPLSIDNLNDPLSPTPLTPNHLITMKSSVILPPPGNFQRPDLYLKKQWRRTQYMVNEFWRRWRTEYLQVLQVRNKWESPQRNVSSGDIVLLKDDNASRNQWRLGRVKDVLVDEDGLVRKVGIQISSSNLDSKGKRSQSLTYLERPVHKLILLLETEEHPVREP